MESIFIVMCRISMIYLFFQIISWTNIFFFFWGINYKGQYWVEEAGMRTEHCYTAELRLKDGEKFLRVLASHSLTRKEKKINFDETTYIKLCSRRRCMSEGRLTPERATRKKTVPSPYEKKTNRISCGMLSATLRLWSHFVEYQLM